VDSPLEPATIGTTFGLDLSSVEIVSLEHKDHSREIACRRPDLFINNSHGSRLPNPARRGIYMCMFPETKRIDLRSYQVITANSRFTAKWIKKRWGYSSEVVYSACHDMGPPSPKERIILNVARFFSDAGNVHHKRQDALLHAFKQLVDGCLRDWELHLVGMVGPTDEDRAFVEKLRDAAAGYPVHIRPAIEFHALQRAYRKASLYWHATGFGTSPAKQPSKQEHFGMAIIEAMSAGAVPIAFDAGGPKETIRTGVNGYLWKDLSELKKSSIRLIEKPRSLQTISAAAAIHSRSFNVTEFLARMDRIIDGLRPTDVRA
jgi:glycosyltransferase involved in cell wall biosynthesis